MDITYRSPIERNELFIRFLGLNGLVLGGVDFRARSGTYRFRQSPSPGGVSDIKFTYAELATAFAGFSEGYQGRSSRYPLSANVISPLELGAEAPLQVLLANEQSLAAMAASKGVLEIGVSPKVLRGALGVTRAEIYIQQYRLGRRANSLDD